MAAKVKKKKKQRGEEVENGPSNAIDDIIFLLYSLP